MKKLDHQIILHLRIHNALIQATGIGGGRGGILKYPPLAEKFWKIPPPLEILGKIFEKTGKNGEN